MKCIAREFVCAAACLALLAGVSRADDKKPEKKPEGDGGKVIVLQLDASKLSPELLKQLLQAAGGARKPGQGEAKKPGNKGDEGGKPGKKGDERKPEKKPEQKKQLSLAEAIAVAEKATSGTAVKAEYAGDGFAVELKTNKGPATVKMDASGNVGGKKGVKKDEDSDKGGKGKGRKKGKKEKEDDDD